MIYAIVTLAAFLVSSANAVCEFTADCTGGSCESTLDTCNWQFPESSYTDDGIPCGMVYSTDIPCPVGGMPIAGGLSGFSIEALEGLKNVISDIVPIGENNEVELSDPDNLDGFILTTEVGQMLNATFIDEGACFRNSVGMITWAASLIPDKMPQEYDEDDRVTVLTHANKTIFFPNVDDFVCQLDKDPINCPASFCTTTVPYLPLGTTVQLKPSTEMDGFVFPPNTFVAFFIVPDGFDRGISPTGTGFTGPSGSIHFSLETLNKADENLVKDTVTALTREGLSNVTINGTDEKTNFTDFLVFIFEDNVNKDYQDVVILVNKPIPAPSCGGILNDCGDICCPEVCGVCGGCDVDCYELSMEFGVECCPGAIRESENFCDFFEEEGCIVIDAEPCDGVGCDIV